MRLAATAVGASSEVSAGGTGGRRRVSVTVGTPASTRTTRVPAAVAMCRSAPAATSTPRSSSTAAASEPSGGVGRCRGWQMTRRSSPPAKVSRALASRGWAASAAEVAGGGVGLRGRDRGGCRRSRRARGRPRCRGSGPDPTRPRSWPRWPPVSRPRLATISARRPTSTGTVRMSGPGSAGGPSTAGGGLGGAGGHAVPS